MTLPVILPSKITRRQAKPVYFPSGNPKIVSIFGGRVMTLPYRHSSIHWDCCIIAVVPIFT